MASRVGACPEAPPLARQLAQPLPNESIIRAPGAVAHRRAIHSQHKARPPLAHTVTGTDMSNGTPHSCGRHHFFRSQVKLAILTDPLHFQVVPICSSPKISLGRKVLNSQRGIAPSCFSSCSTLLLSSSRSLTASSGLTSSK